MQQWHRRQFLTRSGTGLGAAFAAARTDAGQSAAAIDFRYAPLSGQTAFCFPDDAAKSLVGERGELRYGFARGRFETVIGFSVTGVEPDVVTLQELESPAVPIVHTRIDRAEAFLHLTAFATNRASEGRVDNVMVEIRPRTRRTVHGAPIVTVRSRRAVTCKGNAVYLDGGGSLLVASDQQLSGPSDTGVEWVLRGKPGAARADEPLRQFFRFPQEGQALEKIAAGLAEPYALLAEAREFWRAWRPFGEPVSWRMPGRYGEFVTACARNILQARERKNGRLTFQVGPTVYRGLWVVDGNFILEAARYLGYDAEAQQGLETTWALQERDGGIFAGAGREHWKDTGIAMFTLVRQAELSQDWTYFRGMQANVLRGVEFLRGLCAKAAAEGSASGRYGLLPKGMGDGGLGGLRDEFTNTIWVLAGLKAVEQAAARLKLSGFEPVARFHRELDAAFTGAARQEMRRHSAGFDYLPMLMKSDPQWNAADPWDRPQPQVAQWAMSHAIFPGMVFDKDDALVKGHIALMQACTQEDMPAESGWLPHEGTWNYAGAFVAHVYLWAGLEDWARTTFTGFLNHATPLYCWREEQPLRGSLAANYVGDMPHNWASAECVLYLRHMLALEDGAALRLLAGIGEAELAAGEPFAVSGSPTRFGRISMRLEPLGRKQGWRLDFEREPGPTPDSIVLPRGFAPVDPAARKWSATWAV
ncbi:MAG TPA: hypothetical protein VE959_17255 [Bryobacteraceae bacterium]|nr:hypothetical protein [Bryobacteraceae bacterium]